MDDKQVQFLPFNAINEFMVPEYRLNVIQTVLSRLDKLPSGRKTAINNTIKKHVQVSGFRNSLLAPPAVKARASVTAFERRADFTAQVLQGWSELKPELRRQVHEFLTAREWDILPEDADRTQLPGFIPAWPEGQDYDALGQGFSEMFAEADPEENDLRLMIVWLAGRLPYGMYDDEDEVEEESA